MKGDILIIKEEHRKAASQVVEIILNDVQQAVEHYFLTVAGESGAGKSEIAAAIAEEIETKGIENFVFQQDDFFIFPPKTNENKRKDDIEWVGVNEVKISLLEEIIEAIKSGVEEIEKPLVIFDEDKIIEETINVNVKKLIIFEGTYTTALANADCHVFIDRDYHDTKASRAERAREEQDDFLENVLLIEHKIISGHKTKAQIIINKDYSVTKV